MRSGGETTKVLYARVPGLVVVIPTCDPVSRHELKKSKGVEWEGGERWF